LDPEELLADVGDRIRAERQARGWTQDHLGARSGITDTVLSWIERGKGTLPLSHLAAICRGLEIPMSDLLSDGWVMPARVARRAVLSRQQVRILREVVSGDPLPVVAVRVGRTRQAVAARLSESYRLLGVMHLPQHERRLAAFRAAEALGLFEGPTLEGPVTNAA
jgi:transcriptional regulator with XRE-family HTH domain